MKSFLSFFMLLMIKGISNIFYKFEVEWPIRKKDIPWDNIKLIVLLNHTSLLEPLYAGCLPISFLRRLSRKMVAPGADKTLNRPIVGTLYKIFSPGMTAITRKRDDSWQQFMDSIAKDSVIVIIPEGRMKRKNGLDINGQKMTVKGGIADVLSQIHAGEMAIAYSGGLHHVNYPGENRIHLFKKLRLKLEIVNIPQYNAQFSETIGSSEWRKKVVADMQEKLEKNCPAE